MGFLGSFAAFVKMSGYKSKSFILSGTLDENMVMWSFENMGTLEKPTKLIATLLENRPLSMESLILDKEWCKVEASALRLWDACGLLHAV